MLKTYKQHIAYISFSVLLCLFSAGSILKFVDPSGAGWLTLFFLYASIFLATVGLATLAGLMLRMWLIEGVYIINLGNSFRQALLIGIFISLSLALSSQSLLYWWVELSLIAFLAAVEAVFSLK